jgi:hypothetical protein
MSEKSRHRTDAFTRCSTSIGISIRVSCDWQRWFPRMTPSNQPDDAKIPWFQLLFAISAILIVVGVVSVFPVREVESQSFANPAFQRTWVGSVSATTPALDVWGSEPLGWRVEPYAGASKDRRIVQYFERGRMEVESGSNRITSGLLVHEMVNGEIDLGSGVVLDRQTPDISIDSGESHELVPTYITASRLQESTTDRTGQRVTEWIDRDGPVDHSSTPAVVRLEQFVEETGHNLPDVTVALFDQPEFRDDQWVEAFGFPISEPYWTEYRRPDELMPSLIQVFERRILVYTPELDPTRRFTVANSGRHYVDWRYGHQLHQNDIALQPREGELGLTLGDQIEAWVYAEDVDTPIDLARSITGHLMILTQDGRILKADSLDPDGHADRLIEWASGINDPQGLASRGDAVIVTTGDGVRWYREENGRGVLDHRETSHLGDDPSSGSAAIQGTPAINSAGMLFARERSPETGEILREIAEAEPLIQLDEVLHKPGPLIFSRGDLLLAGTAENGRSDVVLIPSVTRGGALDNAMTIARFPEGTTVKGLAAADEEIWDITSYGDVLVAVTDETGARIFGLQRNPVDSEMEMRELAAGQFLPVAIQVGLDGSLYIADAEQNRIIRIQYAS